MTKEMNVKPNYAEELLEILHSSLSNEELLDRLSDYHENDIADALSQLTEDIRYLVQSVWQRSSLTLMIRMNT